MPHLRLENANENNLGNMVVPGKEVGCFGSFLEFIFENRIFNRILSYVSIALFWVYFIAMTYVCNNNKSDFESPIYCSDISVFTTGDNPELIFAYEQYAVGILSIIMVLCFELFFTWVYVYRRNGYKLTWWTGIFIIILNVVIIVIGIAYAKLVALEGEEGRTRFIYANFICLPIILSSWLVFYGIWMNNDYQMYEKKGQKGKFKDHSNGCCDFLDNFFQNLKRIFCCDYSPKTNRDTIAYTSLTFNIVCVVVYTVVASKSVDPWWVGYTVGSWVAIIELTFFMFVKFYQNYFNWSFTVQLNILMAGLIYIAWAVIIGNKIKSLYIDEDEEELENTRLLQEDDMSEEDEDKDFYLLLYYSCVLGYAFIFTMIMSLLKYSTVKSLDKVPSGYLWLFSSSTFIMMAFGAILIYSTSAFDIIGAVILVLGVYCLAYFWLRKWLKWVNVVVAILFVIVCIAGIVKWKDNSEIVLEILSIMLFVFFMAIFGLFLQEAYLNHSKMKNSIFLYSKHVMPVLSYLPQKKKMTPQNKEIMLFSISLAVFLFWSFMAGILLKVEDRYLGILMTTLALCFTFIYLNSLITKAQFIKGDYLGKLNDKCINDSINDAMNKKIIWRGNRESADNINKMESISVQQQGQESEPLPKEVLVDNLYVHKQWQDFAIKC
jgi:hypothetical protein